MAGTLARMVKTARKNMENADGKRVTFAQAGVESGVSSTVLHYIETGKLLSPKMSVIRAISDYFQLPYDDLCIAANRIPEDVFEKVVKNPKLLKIIRDYKA